LDQAPDRDRTLTEPELDELLTAIGDFADLKCPFAIGHSRGVADLAAEAARRAGLSEADTRLVRRAGLVHDLGRLGVPNSVWEKPGPLTEAERERVRLHPYLTGRILRRVKGLADVAAVAAAHHERLDGSGYPLGAGGAALTPC
ncbi:HD domain-containing phosphohydrolase, partial [Amycolatopsis sp. SID8362]|uniref:HD-GYP domain-containing protein n=1 Tax=Amycolatopsis sp. SID8362 TaxID=2690346 RepID=UPI00136AA961